MKKTTEEFKNDVFNLVGNEYSVLSEYINNKTKLLIRHNKCNYEYLVKPNDFQQGKRCPKCSKKLRITSEDFKTKINTLTNNEYTILNDYINSKTSILVRHNKCKTEFHVRPNEFINNIKCPECSKINKLYDNFIKKFNNSKRSRKFELLDDFKNYNTKIHIKCKDCNNDYYVLPNTLLNDKYNCKFCSGLNRKTAEEFKNDIINLVGDEYNILSNYINNKEKVLMKHNVCNTEFYVSPNNFLKGTRCPKCSKKNYQTESYIKKYLDERNIKYNFQVSFNDCKYKRLLKFDFQIFRKDNTFFLLEYDGIQHFKNIYNNEELIKQQTRDNIKNEYCKSNNLELYRINYLELNKIDDILDELIYN